MEGFPSRLFQRARRMRARAVQAALAASFLTGEQDGIRVKRQAAMRKTPPFDADRSGPPSEPASEPTPPAKAAPLGSDEPESSDADGGTAPALVWPPAEDEMSEWEVLQLHSSGSTIIEPLKYTPPSPASGAARTAERPAPVPSAPSAYVPPSPIDDPVGEASLLGPPTGDFDLPETELIEPLHAPTLATMPMPKPPVSGVRPAAIAKAPTAPAPVSGDDRTVMIPRPATLTPPAPKAPEPVDDNQATRILVAPNFAASLGHAPTVPVSALHRAAVPPRPEPVRSEPSSTGERIRPMEDTLPAGMTRELLARTLEGEAATYIQPTPNADTHPMSAIPAARTPGAPVPLGPVPVPGPFSRVPSRAQPPLGSSPSGSTPVAAPDVPPRADQTQTPTTPRLTPPAAAGPAFGPPYAPPSGQSVGAPVPQRVAAPSTRTQLTWLGIAVAALLAIGVGLYQYLSMRDTAAAAPAPATLSVDSAPAGATVTVDGTARGKTPMRLELTEGAHTLEVAAGGTTKKIPLSLVAGTVTAHTIEFAAAPASAATADSAIEIRSEPQGGRVLVDGVARGATPIVVTGLTAGRHEVQVSGPFRTQTRTVTLSPKQQYRLVVAPARTDGSGTTGTPETARTSRASADTGFISIQSPIVLRIVKNGDFIGTSEDGKLSLPAGPQIIGLENESVGFRDVRTVEVVGGKVTPVAVTLPNGSISINARPWAEVFVDGQRLGETPVSQFSLPVGIHEITFRHPDHDERKVSVMVKIGATGRAFTDFTK